MGQNSMIYGCFSAKTEEMSRKFEEDRNRNLANPGTFASFV